AGQIGAERKLGGDDVQRAVVVHVCQLDIEGQVGNIAAVTGDHRDRFRHGERARAVAQVNGVRHTAGGAVAAHDVEVAIAVQVADRHAVSGGVRGAKVRGAVEVAVAVVQPHAVLLGVVDFGDVRVAVFVELAGGEVVAVLNRSAQVHAGRPGAAAAVEVHGALAVVSAHGDVGMAVSVEVGAGDAPFVGAREVLELVGVGVEHGRALR